MSIYKYLDGYTNKTIDSKLTANLYFPEVFCILNILI